MEKAEIKRAKTGDIILDDDKYAEILALRELTLAINFLSVELRK